MAAEFSDKDNEWMTYDEMHDFCDKIDAEIVPLLDQGKFTLDELHNLEKGYHYDNGTKGEGIVVTNIGYKRHGHTRPKGFKLVSETYL